MFILLLYLCILFLGVSLAAISELSPVYTFGSDADHLTIVVSLVCRVNRSLEEVEIRWNHGNRYYTASNATDKDRLSVINTPASNSNSTNTTTLKIHPAIYHDNGTYYCEMRDKGNNASSWISARTNLNLLGRALNESTCMREEELMLHHINFWCNSGIFSFIDRLGRIEKGLLNHLCILSFCNYEHKGWFLC